MLQNCVVFLFSGVSSLGFAASSEPVAFGGRPLHGTQEASLFAGWGGNDTYQMGSEWGKKPVTQDVLTQKYPAFVRASKAAARAGGGTGFYLGTFAGYHVMATNHHVFPMASSCLGSEIRFPLLGVNGRCETFFGTWTDVDLALFAVKVDSTESLQKMESVAKNFDFRSSLKAGQDLVTVGFGVARNRSRAPVANDDHDCRVISKDNSFVFMADPDDINPGPYKAWSFAHGCDVSHGDSGSAMVDRATGNVVGILWTGRIPKQARVQDSFYLDTLVGTDHEDVWEQLSYAVPAQKIAEFFSALLEKPETPADTRAVLEAPLVAP
jgi:hypothetical protein